jgi:hypothetical protein
MGKDKDRYLLPGNIVYVFIILFKPELEDV